MSWFAKSLANTLKLDDDDDDDDGNEIQIDATDEEQRKIKQQNDNQQHQTDPSPPSPSSSSGTPSSRGVKEDLSELTKTLTRQFWGVASFLAPPPPPSPKISDSVSGESSDPAVSEAAGIAGIRSDFAEIGGRVKTGISKLSSNKTMSEFTKMASNFLQFGSDEHVSVDEYLAAGVVGVTDEVVAFVRDITMHPETWLDFPLPDREDSEDFDMSDVQQEHALAVERLAPRLAALRIELCPGYMSEGCFWKIYFVLLHPRLNKLDAQLLSTPQVVEAREMLQQELQSRRKARPELHGSGRGTQEAVISPKEESLSVPSYVHSVIVPPNASTLESSTSDVASDLETEKHPILTTEIPVVDKSVVEEVPVNRALHQSFPSVSSSRALDEKFEDDGDEWLKEDSSEGVGVGGTNIPLGNEEDVSFSDLEEDDGDVPTSYKKVTYGSDSSAKESRDWVQLSRSSDDSSNDTKSVSKKYSGSEQASAHNPEAKESNDWLDVEDIDVV